MIDVFEKVTDEESAHRARELAITEGLFAGYTSGAAMQATSNMQNKVCLMKILKLLLVLPDHGSRYMEKIFM